MSKEFQRENTRTQSDASVRTVDQLGRVVLPLPYRNALQLEAGSRLDIYMRNGAIILRPTKAVCALCGSGDRLVSVGEQQLCGACLESIRSVGEPH